MNDRELSNRILQRWARRETPRYGEVPDARASIRSLTSEDIRGFDNQGLFYDQSDELIPGVDPEPSNSANFRWASNSGYAPLL